MKIGKIILSFVAVVVLILAVVLWYVFNNLNGIVKEVVETAGSDTLKTPVSLGVVDIQLLEARASLGQFKIANYAGFAQPNLMAFDTITVALDKSSLGAEVIVIDEITISGVSISAEEKGGKTNIQTLLDALPKSDSTASKEPEAQSSSGDAPLLAIKKLRFVDNSVGLYTEKYGSTTIDMPEIVQNNIGSATNGLTPEQLAQEIVKPLLKQAQKRIQSGLKDLAKKELEARYGAEIDKAKKDLDTKKDELEKDAADKLGKSLKSLM